MQTALFITSVQSMNNTIFVLSWIPYYVAKEIVANNYIIFETSLRRKRSFSFLGTS